MSTASHPVGGSDSSGPPTGVPQWNLARRNTVRIAYQPNGSGIKSITGRVVKVTEKTVTVLMEKSGEPVTINRDRFRSVIVMQEGDVGGRYRVIVVRALFSAARAMMDVRHVGGNQQRAANYIALALSMIPNLSNGDPDDVWDSLKLANTDIER